MIPQLTQNTEIMPIQRLQDLAGYHFPLDIDNPY